MNNGWNSESEELTYGEEGWNIRRCKGDVGWCGGEYSLRPKKSNYGKCDGQISSTLTKLIVNNIIILFHEY